MKKIIACFILLSLWSCKDDDTTETPGNLNITFENTVDNTILQLQTETYTNSSGETYRVNELKYIISNITLSRKDGGTHTIPVDQSYFVINEADSGSKMITLTDIPAGIYTSMTFGFGVDSSQYPIASGTLNFVPTAEEADMLWSWSAGYKFIKFEGDFTEAGDTTFNPFTIHVGSHGAALDNYKEVTLPLGNDVANTDFKINQDTNASQRIIFDVAAIFDGTNTIRLTDKADIQVDPINAPKIATNIAIAFKKIEG